MGMESLIALALIAFFVWASLRKTTNRDDQVGGQRRSQQSQPTSGSQEATRAQSQSQMRAEIDRAVQRDFGRVATSPRSQARAAAGNEGSLCLPYGRWRCGSVVSPHAAIGGSGGVVPGRQPEDSVLTPRRGLRLGC